MNTFNVIKKKVNPNKNIELKKRKLQMNKVQFETWPLYKISRIKIRFPEILFKKILNEMISKCHSYDTRTLVIIFIWVQFHHSNQNGVLKRIKMSIFTRRKILTVNGV